VTDTVRLPVTVTRQPRTRFSKPRVTATIGFEFGEGETVAEAKADLAAVLTDHFVNAEPPLVLAFGDRVSVSTREPRGWLERTYRRHEDGGLRETGSHGRALHDRQAQEDQVRFGLAQACTVWSDDVSVHAGAAFVPEACVDDLDRYSRREFYRYAAWQRAAAHAIRVMDIVAWHDWATSNWREFQIAPHVGV
jgi:hypothetical protein